MEGPGANIWSAVADAFGRLRGEQVRDLWLTGCRPHSFHRGLFTLDVADSSKKAAIDARYLADLETLFRDLTGSPVRLRTRVLDRPAAASPATEPAPPRPKDGGAESRLLPIATVFAETPANALAYRAIRQLVQEDDRSLVPLFLHGPAGCGKTALARWAMQQLRERDSQIDPLVTSGEALTRDVSRASRTRTFGELQRSWSGRDVVVLDEAHRLRGRPTAQAMATSLIVPALARGGVVLALSRHPPDAIHDLDERLRSHLGAGLVVALEDPDESDRRTILRAAADALPVEIADEVVEVLARRCPGTLTEAVEVLQQEAGRAQRAGRPLQLAALSARLAQPSRGEVTLDELVALLSRQTGIAGERIRSAEKSRDVAAVRHVCVYLASRSLGLSSRQICRSLRLSSPSIVAYARRAVDRRRAFDPEYERLIHGCQARLSGAQRDLPW